ncbi:transposase, partial [Shigella dysenteriae]
STLKSPSYTKSVSWQHYQLPVDNKVSGNSHYDRALSKTGLRNGEHPDVY